MQSKEIWLFIFFLGMFFLGWPMLELTRIPLPYYLYAVWAIFILILGIMATFRHRGDRD